MRHVKNAFYTFLLTITMVTSSVIPITGISKAPIVQAATIKISQKSLTLNVGNTKTLKILASTKRVIWSSNNKTVVTVSSKGTVIAKASGNATITATLNGLRYTCKVTVLDVVTSATRR